MVRFVVDHQDVLEADKILYDALEHLAGRLDGLGSGAGRAGEHRPGSRREVEGRLLLIGVVVRDDHARRIHQRQQIHRHELAFGIVRFGVVGQQHAQTVANRDAGRGDEETVRELVADAVPAGVDGLPGDEHRHDRRLAGAGRQLECDAVEVGVRVVVRVRDLLEDAAPSRRARRDLDKPDQRLDGLHLAEERPVAGEVVMAPVLEQARGLGRDVPFGLRRRAPGRHGVPDGVDELVRAIDGVVDDLLEKFLLDHAVPGRAFAARRCDGRTVARFAPTLIDLAGGLVVRVHFPVTARAFVGGIENGILEKRRCAHAALFPFAGPGFRYAPPRPSTIRQWEHAPVVITIPSLRQGRD